MSNYEIRKAARGKLGGNIFDSIWLMSLVAGLIYSAITGAASSFGLSIVVVGSLNFGLSCIFLKLARGKNSVDLSDFFDGFKVFANTLVLGILQSLFILLWTLLFFFPGIIKSYSYSMSYYIMNDHPEYTPSQCLTESRRIMRGHKLDLFFLDLSFIGWMFVSMFTCGLGFLWLTPYMNMAHAEFYNRLVGSPVDTDFSYTESTEGEGGTTRI